MSRLFSIAGTGGSSSVDRQRPPTRWRRQDGEIQINQVDRSFKPTTGKSVGSAAADIDDLAYQEVKGSHGPGLERELGPESLPRGSR